ncbi:hypothetical protein [Granulosicoccus antarcticus]|uniref:Lipoprotein n=1 Tax=Granulosicoccus antarcticus IMCC3135 TaxID=1192854 RepID=A0A2Z2NYL4_9GAMM|nr:hypothetical protein [Granulosicoccus antarcticus]ASJ74848.1 hypothetical protein IMCC3135_23895 [Granulosicoccus antarcticus IMCC3135]
MRKHHCLAVFLCLFVLSGCESSSRNCDGFNHPLAEAWTGNDGLGETRSFVDNAGNRKTYALQSIDKTDPRVNTSNGSDSNLVPCYETAQYQYVQTNADIAYSLDFLQRDIRGDQPTEDQNVTLTVNTQNPVGTNTDSNVRDWWWLTSFDLNYSSDSPESTTWPGNGSYFPEATINGNVYVDLLQHTFNNNSERFTSGLVDEEAQWVRLVVAKDFGLVQYELLNGTVYTLDRE